MNKVLLDTDILSEIGKGVNPVVTANAAAYRKALGRYTTSSISVMEIVARFSEDEQRTTPANLRRVDRHPGDSPLRRARG